MYFVRILRQIPEKSDVCRFFNQICENKLDQIRKLPKILKSVKHFKYYSILFNRVPNQISELQDRHVHLGGGPEHVHRRVEG